MKKLLLLGILALGFAWPAHGQVAGLNPVVFNGVPSGKCQASQLAVNSQNGNLYTCDAGTWAIVSGGGGSGCTPSATTGEILYTPSGSNCAGIAGSSANSAGNVTLAPPATGVALTVTGAADGSNGIDISGSFNSVAGLNVTQNSPIYNGVAAIQATNTAGGNGNESDSADTDGANPPVGYEADTGEIDSTGSGVNALGAGIAAILNGSNVATDSVVAGDFAAADTSTGGAAALVAGITARFACTALTVNCYGVDIPARGSIAAGVNTAAFEVESQSGGIAIDTAPGDPSFLGPTTAATVTASNLTPGDIPQATTAGKLINSSPLLDNGVTTANTLTYAGSGGITASAGPIKAGGTSGAAGSILLPAGTANSTVTNNVQIQAPASVTAYNLTLPAAAATGFLLGTNSSNTVTVSQVASTGSGSVVLATSPTLVTPALGTPSSAVLSNATGLPLATGVTGNLPVTNLNGGTSASSTTFWRGDGSWATPSGGGGSGGGVVGYSGLPTVTTTVYVPLMGDSAGSTAVANVGWLAPAASPITNLYAYSSSVPGSGNTLVVTLMDGSTAEAVTCTITAAANSCSDLTHSFTPAQGDALSWQISPTGTVVITPNIQIGAAWATPATTGGVTSVTATAPVVSSGGTTPAISLNPFTSSAPSGAIVYQYLSTTLNSAVLPSTANAIALYPIIGSSTPLTVSKLIIDPQVAISGSATADVGIFEYSGTSTTWNNFCSLGGVTTWPTSATATACHQGSNQSALTPPFLFAMCVSGSSNTGALEFVSSYAWQVYSTASTCTGGVLPSTINITIGTLSVIGPTAVPTLALLR